MSGRITIKIIITNVQNIEVMQKIKFEKLFNFEKKSKIKAGDGFKLGEGQYPFYTSSNVLTKSIDEYLFENESLIFGTGGLASIHFCNEKFAVSTDCFVTQPKNSNEVFSKFVYYYLSGNIHILENGFKGAGLKHISKDYLQKIEIPLPSLSTQQKIANILDKADELRQYNKQLIEKYDALTQSLFLDMFGDPVKNEKGWEKCKLSNNSKIRIGPFGSLLHTEDYIENGIPLVNPTHIKKGKIEIDSKLTISQDKMKELETYKLKTNDLILGRRGEMGRCAIVTPNENGFLCGTGSIFIRPLNKLNINYLYKVISSNSFKQVLENSAKGVTMKNLNSKVVGDLEIPLPPIEIQNNFIKSIENIEAQKQQAQEALAKSETLFQGLLQQAFNGELN